MKTFKEKVESESDTESDTESESNEGPDDVLSSDEDGDNSDNESKDESDDDDSKNVSILLSPENANYTMDKKFRIHIIDVQEIFGNNKIKLNIWDYQRPEYPDHIKDMETHLKIGKGSNRLYGTFSIVHNNENDKLYLIDGQHRRKAIENYLKIHKNYHSKIQINIYEATDDQETAQLFNEINNIKFVSDADIPNIEYIKLVDGLQKKYKHAIRDGKKTCYPYITKKILYTRLKESRILERKKVNYSILYEIIVNHNNEKKADVLEKNGYFNEDNRKRYAKCDKWLKDNKNKKGDSRFNRYMTFKKRYTKYQKCINSNFYLGLLKDFEWIEQIEKFLK